MTGFVRDLQFLPDRHIICETFSDGVKVAESLLYADVDERRIRIINVNPRQALAATAQERRGISKMIGELAARFHSMIHLSFSLCTRLSNPKGLKRELKVGARGELGSIVGQ